MQTCLHSDDLGTYPKARAVSLGQSDKTTSGTEAWCVHVPRWKNGECVRVSKAVQLSNHVVNWLGSKYRWQQDALNPIKTWKGWNSCFEYLPKNGKNEQRLNQNVAQQQAKKCKNNKINKTIVMRSGNAKKIIEPMFYNPITQIAVPGDKLSN